MTLNHAGENQPAGSHQPAGGHQPGTLIVILTHNGVDLTRACLASLRKVKQPAHSVLVVDNASTDDTVAMLRSDFPEVLLIANERNLGFAEGNNLGLLYALAYGYKYALLLNNDTEVDPDFLQHLVQGCEADPSVGAVGPLIYYHAAPATVWSAGGTVHRATGRSFMRGIGEVDRGQFAERTQVDFVTGCALLVRCSMLPRTGLLDTRFGMYFEETEWCARMQQAGWKIVLIPEAHVWHKIDLDNRAMSPRVAYYMTRNRLLYMRLTHAPARAWLHAALLQDWRTWLSWGLRPKWRDHAEVRKSIPLAWRDFLAGSFGMSLYWDRK